MCYQVYNEHLVTIQPKAIIEMCNFSTKIVIMLHFHKHKLRKLLRYISNRIIINLLKPSGNFTYDQV
jgi:hypothetical protein